ncbi:MAG: site-specific integrase [Prevotellaceae bacterium]|nr:site-specific integrase [Prevotellaceae bacterium]
MATVKVKFRPSSVGTKEGALYYQVIHNRVIRQINTGYRIFPKEWENMTSSILMPPDAKGERLDYLFLLKSRIKEDLHLLGDIINRLEKSDEPFVTDRIVTLFAATAENRGFVSFTRNLIFQLRQLGKIRTAEAYNTALSSFVRFCGARNEIFFDEMNGGLMVKYENYLKKKGACPNTTSFYMRNLRAVYNRAVEKELTIQRFPFKHVYTGIDKTIKRGVSLKTIRQVRDLVLDNDPLMDYARDLFMFSFYTRGMSFIDMAYLKKNDLHKGMLSYRRQKTNQRLFIKWEKPMQDIVNKYNTSGSPYLLPIIQHVDMDERKQYKSALHLINVKLKKIGALLELDTPLTTYVARHGWASIAKAKNVPISTISEAMGHTSESTTRIYLASLDTSVVDRANNLILNSL